MLVFDQYIELYYDNNKNNKNKFHYEDDDINKDIYIIDNMNQE